jgi:cell division protein FtsL
MNHRVRRMSEKTIEKVVSRNTAIALGIICLVLAVGLVGTIAVYTSTIAGKDSQISSLTTDKTNLQNQVTSLTSEYNIYLANHHYTDSEYNNYVAWLSGNKTNLQSQLNLLTSDKTSLQSQVNFLNSQISNLSSLQSSYLNLSNSYNALIQKYDDLKNVAIQLCDKYGATDGIFILDYKFTSGTSGLSTTYLANMTLYNALLTANVTVELFGKAGGTPITFTYTIPTGETVHKIEAWTGGIFWEDYSCIIIEKVERNW